jgi:hypothetical protein
VPDLSCVYHVVLCVDLMKQKDEMHLTYAELREKYEVRHTSKAQHTQTQTKQSIQADERCSRHAP